VDVSESSDMLVQSVLLAYVVFERPDGVTIVELALRFSAEFGQGHTGDAVERAVRELVRMRLLQMNGSRVIPRLIHLSSSRPPDTALRRG
jgi:hypothetical protein